MTVMRVPLDRADRRIVAVVLLAVLAFLLLCVVLGAGIGAGVAMFRFFAGG